MATFNDTLRITDLLVWRDKSGRMIAGLRENVAGTLLIAGVVVFVVLFAFSLDYLQKECPPQQIEQCE